MKRRITCVWIAVVMLVSLLTAPAAAAGGSGTADDPYLISTPAELAAIGDGDAGTYYRLADDINLASDFHTISSFRGVLDGNGKKLTGMGVLSDVTYDESAGKLVQTVKGMLFDTIEPSGVVYNLNIEDVSYETYFHDIPKNKNGDFLHKVGLIARTNRGVIDTVAVKDANIKAYANRASTCESTYISDELGGMVYRNEGKLINSSISGKIQTSDGRDIGGVVCINTGTIANVQANVEINVCKKSGYARTDLQTISPCVAKNTGLIYNLWSQGKITVDNYVMITNIWKDYNAYLCTANTGTVDHCYYTKTSDESVVYKPTTGSGACTNVEEKSFHQTTFNNNASASDVVGTKPASDSTAPYVLTWKNGDEIYRRDTVYSVNPKVQIPVSINDDYYTESWKIEPDNATVAGGEEYTVSHNATLSATAPQGRYYPIFAGTKTIAPNLSSIPDYPYTWKQVGSDEEAAAPTAEEIAAAGGITRKIAKYSGGLSESDFKDDYTGTLAAGNRFCLRYVIGENTGKLKPGTYPMYEAYYSSVDQPSYKVDKVKVTSSNYLEYLDVTIPPVQKYLAKGGYQYATVSPKEGITAPSGELTLTYLDQDSGETVETPTEPGRYEVRLSFPADSAFYAGNQILLGNLDIVSGDVTPTVIQLGSDEYRYGDPVEIRVTMQGIVDGAGTAEPITGGTVTLKVNGETSGDVKTVDGTELVFPVGILPVGDFTYSIEYSGTPYYEAKTFPEQTGTIGKAEATVDATLSQTTLNYGEDLYLLVTAPSDNLEFRDTMTGGGSYQTDIEYVGEEDGKRKYCYHKPDTGEHQMIVRFNGSDDYDVGFVNVSFTVNKIDIVPSLTIQNTRFREMVAFPVTVADPAGVLTAESGVTADYVVMLEQNGVPKYTHTTNGAFPAENLLLTVPDQVLPGTYDVVLAVGNYSKPNYVNYLNKMGNFTVSRLTPTKNDIELNVPANLVYDKTPKVFTASAAQTGMGDVTLVYESEDGTRSTEAPVNAGTYRIYANVTEGQVYAAATDLLLSEVTVTKATPTADDLTALLNEREDSSFPYSGDPVTAAITCKEEGAFRISRTRYYQKLGSTLSELQEAPVDVGSYALYCDVTESANYQAADNLYVKDFSIAKATPSFDYSLAPLLVTDYVSGIRVEGKVAKSGPNALEPTGSIKYEILNSEGRVSVMGTPPLGEGASFRIGGAKFVVPGTYTLNLTYEGDARYGTKRETYAIEVKHTKATLTVTDTEHRYEPGVVRKIQATTDINELNRNLKVAYYLVDENSGALASDQPVAKPVAAGRYLYVVSLSVTDAFFYEFKGGEYTVTDTTLPNVSDYGNIGFMDIKAGAADAQKPIYFTEGSVALKTGETYQNTLKNDNHSTVTYASGNEAVAQVAADGTVTAKKSGTATITATSTKAGTTPVYASYTVTVKRELTVADFTVTAEPKTYDGTTAAKVSAVLTNPEDENDSVKAEVTAAFTDPNAGENKPVSYEITGLSGKDAGKYVLADSMQGNTVGTVSKAIVMVICPETTTRTYNGEPQKVDLTAMAGGKMLESSMYQITYDGQPEARNVGTYPIALTLTPQADQNYTVEPFTAVLKIAEAAQEVFSIEDVPEQVYYGDSFTVSANGADGTVQYAVTTGSSIATVDPATGEVSVNGAGRVTLTATSVKEGYTTRTATRSFEARKRVLTLTAQAEDKIYDGEAGVAVRLTPGNLVNGDTITATARGTMSNADVGTEKIVTVSNVTLSGDNKDCYTADTVGLQTTVTVSPKEITGFTVQAESKKYDKTAAAQASVTGMTGVLDADLGQVGIVGRAAFDSADSGVDKTVTFTATGLTGAKSGNYRLTAQTAEAKADIAPLQVQFTLGQTTFVYDGTEKQLSVSATDELGRVFRDYELRYSDTLREVGTYTAAVILNDTKNYVSMQGAVTVTISRANQNQLVIAGLPGTVEYGDSFRLEAFGGAEDGDLTWTATGNATVAQDGTVTVTGTGRVEIEAVKKNDNYKDISAKVIFTAVPKYVTFTLGNLEQTYGQVTAVTVDTALSADDYQMTYNGGTDLPVNAGKYKVAVKTVNPNYQGSASDTLTVAKAQPTGQIALSSDQYVYGGEAVSASVTGVPQGADVTVTYAGTGIYVPRAAAPVNAGSYTAIAQIGGANYETVTVTRDFTIEKAPLTVKAKNETRAYGMANPVFTLEYTGFKNGDTKDVLLYEPTATVEANATSPVGEYPITVSGGYGENYRLQYDRTGVLTVTGAAGGTLTVTGSGGSVSVGDVFLLQAFYNNTKVDATWESSDPTVAVIDANGQVTAKGAGTVTITATAGENYGYAKATVTLTVKQTGITLVPKDLVKVYNGQRQEISFEATAGGFTPVLSGEGQNVEVSYTLISDPTVTEPIGAGIYSVSYQIINDSTVTGGGTTTLYINKAKVELQPKDAEKEYGEPASFRLGTDSALVSEEELNALAQSAEFVSEGAALNAPAGSYDLTASLTVTSNANCDFTVNGKATLLVKPAPLTVGVKAVTREYGAENPVPELTVNGFKNEETAEVLGAPVFTYLDTIRKDTPVGAYQNAVSVSGLTSGNYDITYQSGDVTVTKISVQPTAGTARSGSLTVRLDRPVAGLTQDNFTVKKGEETVSLKSVTASADNQTYTLNGSFEIGKTYAVTVLLPDDIYTLTRSELQFTPSRGNTTSGNGGGGGGGGVTTYTVTFDTNGGSKVESVTVNKNKTVAEPAAPTKEGFTFGGWYEDRELTRSYDFSEKVTGDITLYAKWAEQNRGENRMILTIGKREAMVFGVEKVNDVAPKVVLDRTMLPARFVAENLGAQVDWNEEKQQVTVTGRDWNTGEKVVILLTIDSDRATVNGRELILDSPAFVEHDRTYTPLRFIAEHLGATVDWVEEEQKVIITRPEKAEKE